MSGFPHNRAIILCVNSNPQVTLSKSYSFWYNGAMIELENLTKYFGKKRAVQNVNLHIDRGDLFALLGPNGAGKSTILGMIAGLLKPNQGRIKINGKRFENNRNEILHSMGILFENPSFYDYLTGRENITLLARLKGCNNHKKISALFDIVSLSDRANDLVKKYSLGMKQRLALASALISDPDILILDEPTNGLDPEGIHIILALLQDLSANGRKTIIISSHQIYDVESICNKIAIINNGAILCSGRIGDLLKDEIRSCVIKTDQPRECKKFLMDKSWVKSFEFIPNNKNLKQFYIETIQKSRQ